MQFDETNGTQSYKYVYAAYYTAAENFKQQTVFDYQQQATDEDRERYPNLYQTYNEVMHETYESGGSPAALPVPSTP